MRSLNRRFAKLLQRLDAMIGELGLLEKEANFSKLKKTMKVVSAVGTVVGMVGTTTFVVKPIFFDDPFSMDTKVVTAVGVTAVSATCFVLSTEAANKLNGKVELLVDKFELEVDSMEGIFEFIDDVFSDTVEDDKALRKRRKMDKETITTAGKNIKGYMKLAQDVKNNMIAKTDFSAAHRRMTDEFKETLKNFSEEPKYILKAVAKLLDVCYETRYLVLGKDVNADDIKEILKQLKIIKEEYEEILTTLTEFEAKTQT